LPYPYSVSPQKIEPREPILTATAAIKIIGDNNIRLALAAPMSNRRFAHRLSRTDGAVKARNLEALCLLIEPSSCNATTPPRLFCLFMFLLRFPVRVSHHEIPLCP
jgi:hypothetical protein